jgi:hypothetical protein
MGHEQLGVAVVQDVAGLLAGEMVVDGTQEHADLGGGEKQLKKDWIIGGHQRHQVTFPKTCGAQPMAQLIDAL